MKTIKHISLWVVVATCMVAVSTRGNAQAVSSTYFNVDWQFNAPVGNSYADKASGCRKVKRRANRKRRLELKPR